jgi:F0F1-type ATP synthase membrane subunit a
MFDHEHFSFKNILTLTKRLLGKNPVVLAIRKFNLRALIWLGPFLFCSNYFGFLPNFYTLTTNTMLSYTIGGTFVGAIIIYTIRIKTWRFLIMLISQELNIFFRWFVFLIEVIALSSRMISLATRLLANITAGHVLLVILGGILWNLSNTNFLLGFLGFTSMFSLELFISFLQVIIFVILISIYTADIN